MKKILILNGSPRKNGKTASLVKSFVEGAESVGNEVKELYLQGMNIGGCLACEGCQRNGGTCVQKDDMQIVSEDFLRADVVVFASPQYWGTITGQLKIVIDRLYAVLFGAPKVKEFAVIMTALEEYWQHTRCRKRSTGAGFGGKYQIRVVNRTVPLTTIIDYCRGW